MKRLLLVSLLGLALSAQAAPPGKLELQSDDHIAIVGNALADRMQHDGTLEAFIHATHPKDDISIRNLGFAADEINQHVRSMDVPPPEEWLIKHKTDVILAFWGFNESFKGYEGLEEFKAALDKYLKTTLAAQYNGKSGPRLVLFSPIAQEKMPDGNFPDAAANNTNLQNYTVAMAEVAKANDVQFVDLFGPSQKLYAAAKQPLTHNGIHLTVAGYQALAPVIYQAVFGAPPPAASPEIEKLREAVVVKNHLWLSRYRTVDQFNIFGQRSTIGYESGKGGPKIDNRAILWPELAVRDVMTANREKRVWALAQGNDLKIDDSNVPEVPKVGTNKPGPNPDGSYPFLDPEEAIRHMTVPKGVKVELVASEKEFPELVSPVQMAWDTKGRLWISAWKNYPERTPWSKEGDKLLVFDIGANGRATKCTTFLDQLNCPTGFQFYKDGVVVMESPDLWFVRDVNGKGVLQERLLNGLDAADSHHETNSMAIEPGGAIYLSDGVFHRTQVETAWGPVRNQDGCLYRWEPRTGRFERYVAYGFANPHGKVFDYWGNDIMTDATGNANFFGPAFSGHIDEPAKHPGMKEFWARPSRPCPGTAILSSRAWPAEFNGNFLNTNVIGIQGIFRAKITEEGSGLHGETIMKTGANGEVLKTENGQPILDNLVTSDDPNFRPSGVSVAPDGSIYFMDWHKPLIGHLQHHLRDPNREMDHGRIYRLTYEGMPLLKPAKIAGEPIEKLLDLLKEPENNVRERAKIELGGRNTGEVDAALYLWVAGLDAKDPAYEHHLLEALWVKQYHNVVDEGLLKRVLASPDARARAQAIRVITYQRDRIKEPLALIKPLADDESPRVRLEAIRAASFFRGNDVAEAFTIAANALKKPADYYIDYCFKETAKQLQSLSKETLVPTDPAALAAAIQRMSDSDLNRAAVTEPILVERLQRKSIAPENKEKALAQLATLHKSDRTTELVAALQRFDQGQGGANVASDEIAKMLAATPAPDLLKARALLETLSEQAKDASVRRAAWTALIMADQDPTKSWVAAGISREGGTRFAATQEAFVSAIGNVADPALRAKFAPILASKLKDGTTPDGVRHAALRALPLTGTENAKANFAILADHLKRDQNRTEAARGILQLPRDSWDKATAGSLAEGILAWAKSVPAADRSKQDFIEIVQAGSELASLMLPADAARIRKDLRGLGVSVFVVKTVREQMRYDTPRLVVEAGKPSEIIFENLDAMGHNLVIVQPGTRQAVAEAVQTRRPDQLDKKGRAYVPEDGRNQDKRVLEATRMVEPDQKETLKMNAPGREGEYEYVCTMPGHWLIMWGKLIVTKNVDAYLQAHPSADPTGVDALLPK